MCCQHHFPVTHNDRLLGTFESGRAKISAWYSTACITHWWVCRNLELQNINIPFCWLTGMSVISFYRHAALGRTTKWSQMFPVIQIRAPRVWILWKSHREFVEAPPQARTACFIARLHVCIIELKMGWCTCQVVCEPPCLLPGHVRNWLNVIIFNLSQKTYRYVRDFYKLISFLGVQ